MYDSSSKKMVTWKDTVRKTIGDEVVDGMGDEKASTSKGKALKAIKAPELTCKATQSEKFRKEKNKIQCEKILSCNDVLHKDQPKKIPLSKYSFKSKLNSTGDSVTCIAVGRKTDEVTSLESNTTITAKSSSIDLDDLNIDIDKRSSCNSVANAFEKLKINSEHDLKSEEMQGSSLSDQNITTEILESDSLVDIPLIDIKSGEGLNESVLPARSEFERLENAHKEMSKWFDGYVKESPSGSCIDDTEPEKYEEEIETCDKQGDLTSNSLETDVTVPLIEEEEETYENFVLLFKSTTDLDLVKGTSDFTLTRKKSDGHLRKDISEETFATTCELDSTQSSCRRQSHFSLKKSMSDLCLGSVQSNYGLSSKNTLVSIYWNKNREASDEESLVGNRKLVSSLPNIPIHGLVYKNEAEQETSCASVIKSKIFKQNEQLRRKILEIAAGEFVKDCHEASAKETVPQESSSEDPLLKFLEEEYTVPKKRRKVDSTCAKKKRQKVFRFSAGQNFDLDKFRALTISGNANTLEYDFQENDTKSIVKAKREDGSGEISSVRSDSTLCGSSSAVDYSPRIFAILDNVLNGDRHRADDKSLIVMTPSDCRRLIDLDGGKLPELQRRLKKIKRRQLRRRPDCLKLPAIGNRERIIREDKEIQVDEVLSLPKIVDKKLRRRDTVKKLEVDVRMDVGDVYLEYDSER